MLELLRVAQVRRPLRTCRGRTLVAHDQHCQMGLVIRDCYRDYMRAVATAARYSLAWIDTPLDGLVVGSVQLRDAWTADSTILEEQLNDFGGALLRMRALEATRWRRRLAEIGTHTAPT